MHVTRSDYTIYVQKHKTSQGNNYSQLIELGNLSANQTEKTAGSWKHPQNTFAERERDAEARNEASAKSKVGGSGGRGRLPLFAVHSTRDSSTDNYSASRVEIAPQSEAQ